jgi:pantoate--beta-alanine ligase
VCTVVAKLLNIVTPDVAFFGAKDAQQVAVVRRMARDLDLPVRLAVIGTVREDDGLAMSSRNVLLSAAERERAAALPEALRAVQALAAAGQRDPERLREAGHTAMAARGVAPEYLALVDPETFSPVPDASGRVLVVVAARIGATRLIDNILLDASPALAATG